MTCTVQSFSPDSTCTCQDVDDYATALSIASELFDFAVEIYDQDGTLAITLAPVFAPDVLHHVLA
jgi:hypothetical protein